jgi:hypothetical protein
LAKEMGDSLRHSAMGNDELGGLLGVVSTLGPQLPQSGLLPCRSRSLCRQTAKNELAGIV